MRGTRGNSRGYDPADMQELDRLIAARVKVPRAELERAREQEPGDTLRRVIGREG